MPNLGKTLAVITTIGMFAVLASYAYGKYPPPHHLSPTQQLMRDEQATYSAAQPVVIKGASDTESAAYTAADVQGVNKLIASVPPHLTRAQLNAQLKAEYAGRPQKVVAALDEVYRQPWVRP